MWKFNVPSIISKTTPFQQFPLGISFGVVLLSTIRTIKGFDAKYKTSIDLPLYNNKIRIDANTMINDEIH